MRSKVWCLRRLKMLYIPECSFLIALLWLPACRARLPITSLELASGLVHGHLTTHLSWILRLWRTTWACSAFLLTALLAGKALLPEVLERHIDRTASTNNSRDRREKI